MNSYRKLGYFSKNSYGVPYEFLLKIHRGYHINFLMNLYITPATNKAKAQVEDQKTAENQRCV